MYGDEIREIRVPIKGGKLVTILVQEKGRKTLEGAEGTVFALLHPTALFEMGEYWAPIAP
jgi:hypothetical protein